MENQINITYSVVAYSTTVEDEDNIIDLLDYCSSLSEVLNFIDECDTTSREVYHYIIKTMINCEVVGEENLTKSY